MRYSLRAPLLATALLAGLMGQLPTSAQTLYGSLTGNISDPTGAALPKAKIEAMNLATGVTKSTTTDDRGAYQMSDLLPGTYKISISAPAFGTRVQEGANIAINTVLRLDAALSVSQVVESIAVSASAVTLQTDRADIK